LLGSLNYDISLIHMQNERIDFLANNIDVLNRLCLKLDPYKPVSKEHQNLLKAFNIEDFYDPFKVTNQLLVLLENYIEELHSLQNNETIQ